MYDLAVVGLGPAGIEAVKLALENNLKVIAFEKNELGGTCLNVGCIPTKAIIHSSDFYSQTKKASSLGLQFFAEPTFDWGKILDRKTQIVSKFKKALDLSFSKKITLVKSEAELFLNETEVEIYAEDNIYQAKNLIIASGSKPVTIKGLEPDSKFIFNSDDIFNFPILPKKIAIVGSGAIGLEWAKIFSDLGVQVKLIEKAPTIAPMCDVDIQKRIERTLKANSVEIYKNNSIKSYCQNRVELEDGTLFEVDCILSAVGRKPLLPKIKINGCNENYKIQVEDDCSTEFENVFVVGDATGELLLAHFASYQARMIINKIVSNKPIIKKDVPSVIYLSPEVASIGLKEQDVVGFDDYKIIKLPIGSIAKSWCDNQNDGLIKLIIKDRFIKGAHIISNEASSLITLIGVFIEKDISIDEIKEMIFPHPSYAEIILEVLRNV